MDMTSQQTLPVPKAVAWEALNDFTLLQAAIPGCEGIHPVPDKPDHYEAVVTAAVGPVKAKFKGKLQLQDITPPEGYKLVFEGQGGAAGHAKGHAEIRLEATGPHETLLRYTAHATVGGKIAQLGSRLVDMAAQKMANEFFERFTAALTERYAPPPPPVDVPAVVAEAPTAPPGLLTRLLQWLKGLFGG